MKYFFLSIALLLLKLSFSQTVLMHEKVDSVYKTSDYGINSKYYLNTYMSYGFIFDKSSTNVEKTKFWGTQSIAYGLRFKYKILNHWASGLETELRYSSFNIPVDKPLLKKQYRFLDLRMAWYNRINFGMRGAIMGKFLDFGVFGSRILNAERYTKFDPNNSEFKHSIRVDHGLNIFNNFNYGLLLRIGLNQWVLFSEYRFSDLLDEDKWSESLSFPRWTVGLQFNFHR